MSNTITSKLIGESTVCRHFIASRWLIFLVIIFSVSTSYAQSEFSNHCIDLKGIDFFTAHELEKETYLRSARCMITLPDDEIRQNIDSLVFLMPKLSYYNKIELLDSIIKKFRPFVKNQSSRYKLSRSEADLARKNYQWSTADTLYDRVAKLGTSEYEKSISYIFSGYCAAVSGNDERARTQYEKGMAIIEDPTVLDSEEYYSVFNLSAAVNSYLGSQEITAQNYLKIYNNAEISISNRAQAAYNLLNIYSGNKLCDSVRLLAHFARVNLDPDLSRNRVYWQLIKCDGIESLQDSAQIHYKSLVNDTTATGRFLNNFIQSDYYSATNQGAKILPILENYIKNNPDDVANTQYLREAYMRSFLNKSDPLSDRIIEDYCTIKDSLTGVKLSQNLAESQVALDFKISEANAAVLTRELEFSEQRSKLRMLLALSLGFGLLLGSYLFFQIKKQKAKLDQSNRDISTLNTELNHRTSNQISLAYELILDQRRQIGDEQAKASLERSESQLMALREVNRALAHRSDDLVRADEVLTKVAENLQAASPYPFALDLQLKAISVHGNAASRSALILSELLSNSIKYAFPKTENASATISITQSDSETSITYLDNGPGADGTVRGTGVGSGLIEAMLEDLDAEFEEIKGADGTGYGMRWWWG